jgi:hypothetical protein
LVNQIIEPVTMKLPVIQSVEFLNPAKRDDAVTKSSSKMDVEPTLNHIPYRAPEEQADAPARK